MVRSEYTPIVYITILILERLMLNANVISVSASTIIIETSLLTRSFNHRVNAAKDISVLRKSASASTSTSTSSLLLHLEGPQPRAVRFILHHPTTTRMRLQLFASSIFLLFGAGLVSGRGISARDADDDDCKDLCTKYWNCVNIDSYSGTQCNPPTWCDC